MKIGVISDTHDYFDPKIPRLFKGVDHILHGGDIGLPAILFELEQIAPVTAVMGNTDDIAFNYRLTEVVTLENRKFLLHHIVNPHHLAEPLQARIFKEQPQAVVFGHTHRPCTDIVDGILFLNPGYAGKQRFDLRRSVAILHCDRTMRPELIPL